jgi:hypothetical protein
LETDGDNKYPGGYLYKHEEPSSSIVRMEQPFFTISSGILIMTLIIIKFVQIPSIESKKKEGVVSI